VNVTRALDPSPPRRQNCDEILSPSTGAGSTGAIASKGSVAVVSTGAVAGLGGDGTGSGAAATARRTGSLSAVVLLEEPDTSIHAPSPMIRAAGNQINPRLKVLACPLSG
jgi:hypothetical protein